MRFDITLQQYQVHADPFQSHVFTFCHHAQYL